MIYPVGMFLLPVRRRTLLLCSTRRNRFPTCDLRPYVNAIRDRGFSLARVFPCPRLPIWLMRRCLAKASLPPKPPGVFDRIGKHLQSPAGSSRLFVATKLQNPPAKPRRRNGNVILRRTTPGGGAPGVWKWGARGSERGSCV